MTTCKERVCDTEKGLEQKYFGVLGPSAGKIIFLIFYRASHMVLRSYRQLHYPCKLSGLLKPVKLQKFTIAVIWAEYILWIFFSFNIAWTSFVMNWFSHQSFLRKLSTLFTSSDPSVLSRAPTSTQWGCAGSHWKVTVDKKAAWRRNLSCCFQSCFWLFAWLQKCHLFITSWEIFFCLFHMWGRKRWFCASFSHFWSCDFFFCFVLKTGLNWMTKWKIKSKQLCLLGNLLRNMQEQVTWIMECTG